MDVPTLLHLPTPFPHLLHQLTFPHMMITILWGAVPREEREIAVTLEGLV